MRFTNNKIRSLGMALMIVAIILFLVLLSIASRDNKTAVLILGLAAGMIGFVGVILSVVEDKEA